MALEPRRSDSAGRCSASKVRALAHKQGFAKSAEDAWVLSKMSRFGFVLLLLGLVGCAPTWPPMLPSSVEAPPPMADLHAAQIFQDLLPSKKRAPDASETEAFPPIENVRPCCAFGNELGVSVAGVPIPGFRMSNIVAHDDLGHHRYDHGVGTIDGDWGEGLFFKERNGLAYTCRGGFIDTAHVRDYADWTVFLYREILEAIDGGTVLELPEEAGKRFLYVVDAASEMPSEKERQRHALDEASRVAFNLSLWHEIATWYGWSAWSAFPETASAFSPEDLYSNELGIQLAGYLIRDGWSDSQNDYEEAMDLAFPVILERLGAAAPELTAAAADAVDGLWWRSDQKLPASYLVARRAFALEQPLEPWLIDSARLESTARETVQRYCGQIDRGPIGLTRVEPASLDFVRLEIDLGERVAASMPSWLPEGKRLRQDDFPTVVKAIRDELVANEGAHAATPGSNPVEGYPLEATAPQ